MKRPIRLMCVDDNRLMADALERRLRNEDGIEWVGWVEEASRALLAVRESQPDVVLLDIDMPGQDCFELVGEIAQIRPETRVIMFSGHVRADYVDRAIDAGAWGYASKNDRIGDLLDAIGRAVAGEFVITPDVASEYEAKK
ncbi:MAG TPA: response regulator transcription factor [Phycisphaerales bacterium]|nr:response regulator transcription factor [Phycisphaerales bacterium]